MNKKEHWNYNIAGLNSSFLSAKNSNYLKSKSGFDLLSHFGLGRQSSSAVDGVKQSARKVPGKLKDKEAPRASLSLLNSVTGGSTYRFLVTYRDNKGIKASSLDNQDVRITGNGFNQIARLVSKTASSGGKVYKVIYQITAPGGTWNAVDNGIYNIALRSRQVRDVNRNYATAKTLGFFSVNISNPDQPSSLDLGKPKARMNPIKTIKINTIENFNQPCTFTVTYTDNLAIDASSIDSDDITITNKRGTPQQVEVNKVVGGPTSCTVTYQLKIPDSKDAWIYADRGQYDVVMKPNQVKDVNGNAVDGSALGSLLIDVSLYSAEEEPGSDNQKSAKDFIIDLNTSTGIVQSFEFMLGQKSFSDADYIKVRFDPAAIKAATSIEDLLSRSELKGSYLQSIINDPYTDYNLKDANLFYFVSFNSYKNFPKNEASVIWNNSSSVLVFGVKTSSRGSDLSLLDTALKGTNPTTVLTGVRFAGDVKNFLAFAIKNLR